MPSAPDSPAGPTTPDLAPQIAFWQRIAPPAAVASDFSADIARLVDAFHRLPAADMAEDAADFAPRLEALAAPALLPARAPAPPEREGLAALAAGVADGKFTARALAETALARIAARADLNAVLSTRTDAALEAADALGRRSAAGDPLPALAGVPMAHKDMFNRIGEAASCGSLIRRETIASSTATVLDRLDAAGALHVARLNMSEFAQGPTGHNRHHGAARNPWDPDRVSGGSSSGSGVAVAARLVPAALGSDTGGSVRIPASLCGVTGLKPTWSRVSRADAMPLAPSLDVIGPLAPSARDCARLMDVIAGADGRDATASPRPVAPHEAALDGDIRGLRIGLPDGGFLDGVAPAIFIRFEAALTVLEARGARHRPVRLAAMDAVAVHSALLSKVEVASVHAAFLRTRAADYGVQVSARMYPGLAIPGSMYLEAARRRAGVLSAFVAAAFADADVLAMPTIKTTPPTRAESDVEAGVAGAVAKFLSLSANTRAFNYLGLPAITVPIGLDDHGMPAGLQLVGRPFAEAQLLRIADAFQRDTAFHRALPPGITAFAPAGAG